MTSNRLYHVALMLFWIATLAMLSLMCIHAPNGGLEIAGLRLFADPGFAGDYAAALSSLGIGPAGQWTMLGLVAACDMAAAGLLIFAMLFVGFGQPQDRNEARTLIEGAAAILVLAALAVVLPAISAGQSGMLAGLQAFVLTGLAVSHAGWLPISEPAGRDHGGELDEIIAGHAASHAAFTAQLALIARREPGA